MTSKNNYLNIDESGFIPSYLIDPEQLKKDMKMTAEFIKLHKASKIKSNRSSKNIVRVKIKK